MIFLDAREMLSTFMVGSMPDPERFKSAVGSVIERSGRRTDRPCVRAYGEMVDLLWKDGNPAAAIWLEELWNDLASTHSFSLMCTYAMGNFYRAADAKAIDVIVQLDEPTQSVIGDAARLHQVIWNLLLNAVKFTPREGRVELRVGRAASEAQIVVRDTGPGIAPDAIFTVRIPLRAARLTSGA